MSEDLCLSLRPTELSELIGQNHLVKPLGASIKKQSTQAYLLNGPSGTGKTTIARIIANHREAGDNIMEIDAASNSGADKARDIVEQVRLQPLGGGNRCVIVDECHQLSKVAWNVFLKPIEEPPPSLIWCFCTTERAKVPTAIQNRCEVYVTRPVEEDVLVAYLRSVAKPNGVKLLKNVPQLIADSAEGSVRQAVRFLQQCNGLDLDAAGELIAHELRSASGASLAQAISKGVNWKTVTGIISGLQPSECESVRRGVIGYYEKVAMGQSSFKNARWALAIIEAFSEYKFIEGRGELLLMVGGLIGE